jgi:hypothetical protein
MANGDHRGNLSQILGARERANQLSTLISDEVPIRGLLLPFHVLVPAVPASAHDLGASSSVGSEHDCYRTGNVDQWNWNLMEFTAIYGKSI